MSKTNGTTPDASNIDDPGEFNQIQALKRIHRARDRVVDHRSKLIESTMLGRLSREEAHQLYYEAVAGYITELEALLSSLDDGEEYWENEVVLHDTIEPPAEAIELFEEHVVRTPDGMTRPQPCEVKIEGLKQFIEFGASISLSWGVAYRGNSGMERETFEVERPIPRRISDYAYRLTNRFLRDIGLDAKLEDVRETKEVEWGSTQEDGWD